MITASTSVWITGDRVLSDVTLGRYDDGSVIADLDGVHLVFENLAHATRWLRLLADRIERVYAPNEEAPADVATVDQGPVRQHPHQEHHERRRRYLMATPQQDTATFEVTFERIGRSHHDHVETFTVPTEDMYEALGDAIYKFGRPFLRSSDVDLILGDGHGRFRCGFQSGGSFTFRQAEG